VIVNQGYAEGCQLQAGQQEVCVCVGGGGEDVQGANAQHGMTSADTARSNGCTAQGYPAAQGYP
jgi:hypothetical protein